MNRFNTFRVGASLAATSVLLVGTVVTGVGVASGATSPKITATPSTNLKNGSTVKITGKGFKPGDTVYIVECLRKAKGSNGCAVPAGFPPSATITSKGTLGLVKFKVSTGAVGSGKCGTAKSNLALCDVSVGNAAGKDSATFPITFK